MAVYQVTRVGTRFGVMKDGVVVLTRDTRGEATKEAIKLKEGN